MRKSQKRKKWNNWILNQFCESSCAMKFSLCVQYYFRWMKYFTVKTVKIINFLFFFLYSKNGSSSFRWMNTHKLRFIIITHPINTFQCNFQTKYEKKKLKIKINFIVIQAYSLNLCINFKGFIRDNVTRDIGQNWCQLHMIGLVTGRSANKVF